MYLLFADVVIVVHFLFIVFVVAGGFIVLYHPRLAWAHVPAALWGAAIEFTGWICPLTPLENFLRRLGGETAYGGDFIAHYLIPVIYPPGLTAAVQIVLGALVVAINLVAYALVLLRRRPRKDA
ncbi:MAG: DUF2784 domain-containing protein [Deltaproteobacteria bacterium]|nr:DUF2784 domain-containing protein [Syntrophaceae bacterium]